MQITLWNNCQIRHNIWLYFDICNASLILLKEVHRPGMVPLWEPMVLDKSRKKALSRAVIGDGNLATVESIKIPRLKIADLPIH